MAMKWRGYRTVYKGKFLPINPKKYVGDVTSIVFRSSWECKYMSSLDTDPNVISWASEEVIVNYFDPSKGKYRRYFPDFLVRYKDDTVEMVEIKPSVQTIPPKLGKKSQKTILAEAATYATNSAKWEMARAYCRKKGWKFILLTERGRIDLTAI